MIKSRISKFKGSQQLFNFSFISEERIVRPIIDVFSVFRKCTKSKKLDQQKQYII